MSDRINDVPLRLKIDSLGFEGVAVGRIDGIVHFVKGALPGETVDIRITRKKKNYKLAKVINILDRATERIDPLCEYFGTCGGCSWQHLAYDSQLRWKKSHVEEALVRIGKIQIGELFDTLPSPSPFNYRNKMEFSFSHQRWITEEEIASGKPLEDKFFGLGLHIPERFDKVLDINHCDIQHEYGNLILNYVRDAAKTNELTGYNFLNHTGFLRNLIIRRSELQDKFLVVLVTNQANEDSEIEFINRMAEEIRQKFDKISGFVHAVNISKNSATIDGWKLMSGSEILEEEVLGVRYEISPFSFFQTNSLQLNPFISKILEFAGLDQSMTVWDLYCGTGSITLPAAKQSNVIYGFEMVESSINDANRNKEYNKIENANFKALDLHAKDITETLRQYPTPDTIIVDPPRNGMHKNLIDVLININPKKIIYVSCNPTTQARDLNMLKEYYKIARVQPVDIFPQTFHVESIAELISL